MKVKVRKVLAQALASEQQVSAKLRVELYQHGMNGQWVTDLKIEVERLKRKVDEQKQRIANLVDELKTANNGN